MDGILLIKKIGIIGGGISGLVVGIFLAKEGHQVSIFEKDEYYSRECYIIYSRLSNGTRS